MDSALEASSQRVCHHLRRPLAGSRNLLMKNAGNTVPVTDPGRVSDSVWFLAEGQLPVPRTVALGFVVGERLLMVQWQ